MRWRVYYGDGSTYSDRDGAPWDAPAANVQVIAIEAPEQPQGFTLWHTKDAYYWDEDGGRWVACDVFGMWDYLFFHRGPKTILFGRTLRDDAFWSIVERATREGLG